MKPPGIFSMRIRTGGPALTRYAAQRGYAVGDNQQPAIRSLVWSAFSRSPKPRLYLYPFVSKFTNLLSRSISSGMRYGLPEHPGCLWARPWARSLHDEIPPERPRAGLGQHWSTNRLTYLIFLGLFLLGLVVSILGTLWRFWPSR